VPAFRAASEPLPRPDVREILSSLQRMAPGLVHELRNPLSGILAGSQMLERALPAGAPVREYAEIVHQEAQRLERFLTRIGQFGRLAADGLTLQAGLDLNGLLATVLAEGAPGWREAGIAVVTRLDPALPVVEGDAGRLAQAAREILQNARDAMAGGGTLTVSTRQLAPDELEFPAAARGRGPAVPLVAAEFADTGDGMSPEARERAFEPFFSTRPRALGVGLALAQVIALAHGGTLWLPPAGAGARVVLGVPARSATASPVS